MSMRAYAFWTENGTIEASPSLGTLTLHPRGLYQGEELQVQFPNGTTPELKLAIADRVLAEVQRWRDGIAERADEERTAATELEVARAEIARLKAEAGEES